MGFAFFDWVVWAVDINLLLVFNSIIFKYFLPNHRLSICFMVSFAVQKLLSLIRSHLFIFAFISFALGDRSKKYCYNLCQRMFFLWYLLGVLWFPVIHLGLQYFVSLFLYMVLENYNFILLHVASVFPALVIEETVFSPLYNLASFVIDWP